MFLLNLRASRSKHFTGLVVLFCTMSNYVGYKTFIASISIWFCYLKTVLIVLYLLSQILPPPRRFFFSWGKLYWHIDTFSCYTLGIQNLGKRFSIEMFVNNTLQFLVYRKKPSKTPCWISFNFYSNRAHNFVKHLVGLPWPTWRFCWFFDTFPRSRDTGRHLYYNYQKP